MALNFRNLCVASYCNGFTLWHYKTATDTLAQITDRRLTGEPDYFGEASDMLTMGDWIMVNAKDGSRQLVVRCVMQDTVMTASLS